ncbi:MAG: glycosyltransferase [Microcoleaceae cyanobacterium]
MTTKAAKFSQLMHLWIPNIFEFKGGIQVYSGRFLDAFQQLYPDFDYHVFLKHDIHIPENISYSSSTQFSLCGSWPLKLRTPAFAVQLISSVLLEQPNLIISAHLNFLVAAYWLKCFTGIPYWAIAYGMEAWDIQQSSLRTALHHADQIICIGNYTRSRLIKEQNLDEKKLSILPCTFDSSRFQISNKPDYLLTRYHLKSDQPIILTVNRLVSGESYRGYDKILEALPLIRQVIPNIHYIIVGKGDDRPRLEQFIAERHLQDHVTLTGFIPDLELSDHYNLCDVFAMPSKLEGFGIVYLEALACGKPVLGGNQDGAVDALCEGELGALINPEDVEDIAKTLIQILKHQYSNALIYHPESLRNKVNEIYGLESFNNQLGYLVKKFYPNLPHTQDIS